MANNAQVSELISSLQSPEKRWQAAAGAASVGPDAIADLGRLMASDDPATAKAAGEALRKVVCAAAAPGSKDRAKAASGLEGLITSATPRQVRSDALLLMGQVGGDAQVPALIALLREPDVREDARMALERIPGKRATQALERELQQASPGYRPAIQQSLRARG